MWNERVVRELCARIGLTVNDAGLMSGIPDLERQLEGTIPAYPDMENLGKTLGVLPDQLMGSKPED